MTIRIAETGNRYQPEDVAIRPNSQRFNPTEWEKQLASAPWIDCDPVARQHVEETGIADEVFYDHHGYPTA